MKITIEYETGNEAFSDTESINEAIKESFTDFLDRGKNNIKDINWNTVGKIYYWDSRKYIVFDGIEKTIKWIYDSFNKADTYAEKLYFTDVGYLKSEATYDNLGRGKYECYKQVFWLGVELYSSYVVNELEYELNEPCEIELS